MSKFNDFYGKITEDEKIAKEVAIVLGGDTFENASDEKLFKIGEIAKKAGFEFTLDEARAYFGEGELEDDDLDAVAGGKPDNTIPMPRPEDFINGNEEKSDAVDGII